MIGIYKITNLINNKVYIGQSTNIKERWKAHRSRPFQKNSEQYNSLLYRSIRKYGLENFSFEIIEECDKRFLDEREIYWIAYYSSNNFENGYNLTKGGDSATYSKLTEKQVEEIIKLLQNTAISQEEIAKQYQVTQRTISGINIGQCWKKEKTIYPLRDNSTCIKSKIQLAEKKYCIDCGIEITPNAQRCIKCAQLNSRRIERPSRDKLKNLIRTKPFLEIGKMYGVSDNAIRKWCKAEKLPYKKSDIKKYTDEEWENI